MDESDEDIDPLMGPVADLMAEHNLSSTTTDIKNPVEIIEIPEQKTKILDYLSFLNIHSLFKDIFNYIIDIQWYHYINKISPQIEQEIFLNPSQIYSSLKTLSLLFIVSISLSHFLSQLFSIFRSMQFSLHHFHLHFIVYCLFIFYISLSLIFFSHFISIIIGFNV
jgi:hypothetical protein